MFRLLGWIIKASLFAAAVLIIGNIVHWRGKTISDQVKTSLAHAERPNQISNKFDDTVDDLKTWANHVTEGSQAEKKRSGKKIASEKTFVESSPKARQNNSTKLASVTSSKSAAQNSEQNAKEEIPSSERQKLRSLIRELNSPTN
jgi:hypothetical protein